MIYKPFKFVNKIPTRGGELGFTPIWIFPFILVLGYTEVYEKAIYRSLMAGGLHTENRLIYVK
jgi:hypothetical protein